MFALRDLRAGRISKSTAHEEGQPSDTRDNDQLLGQTTAKTRGQGWGGEGAPSKFFLISGAVVITIVSTINIIFMVWGILHHPLIEGYGLVTRTSCHRTKTTVSILHLIINVLSTLMLAASNYCMQSLAAPTRAEVDHAHSKCTSLDIGIQSLRNLRYISKRRALVWCILGLSSTPLHLISVSRASCIIPVLTYLAQVQ
jgi:hypothetical protein